MKDAHALFDRAAPKKATNLSINEDLLRKAKALHINCSSVLEDALESLLRAEQQQAWQRENASSIAAYNAQVGTDGVFSDGLRSF